MVVYQRKNWSILEIKIKHFFSEYFASFWLVLSEAHVIRIPTGQIKCERNMIFCCNLQEAKNIVV